MKALILSMLLASSFAHAAEIGQPATYFGVNTCGKKVLWVLTVEGKFYRFDDANTTQADFAIILKQLQGLKGDLVNIPCPTTI